ncbi:MAG: hypothetical protein U0640_09140 [Phycisphaerales bacterium]
MRNKCRFLIVVASALLGVRTGLAQSCNCPVTTVPSIEIHTSNLNCSGITCVDNAGVITITVSSAASCGGPGNIQVHAIGSGTIIGSISVGLSGGTNDIVGIDVSPHPNGTITQLGSIIRTTSLDSGNLNVGLVTSIGTITGTWTVSNIDRIQASGNITASFNVAGSSSGVSPGDVFSIRSDNGSITGNITANGTISGIIVPLGTVGTSSAVSTINCRGDLIAMSAQSIYSDINTRYNGGTGDVYFLRTTTGDFGGSLSTTDIDSHGTGGINKGLQIAGNLQASIDCEGQIKEQVVVNRAALQGVTWTGNTVVGASNTLLSPQPYYDNPAATLGGGAVGLVPYMVHYEDCSPIAYGDPVTPLTGCNAHVVVSGPVNEVSIAHYGRVGFWNATTGLIQDTVPANTKAFTIRRALLPDCTTWTDVSSSFTAIVVSTSNGRTIRISGLNGATFAAPSGCSQSYLYSICPERVQASGSSPVVCKDTVSPPPAVGDYEYRIRVDGTDCGGWGGN